MKRIAAVSIAMVVACGSGGDDDVPWDAPVFSADAGADRYAVVGELVMLDGSASAGAVTYRWDDGAGGQADGAVVGFSYDAPGRYQVVLTVTDAAGATRSDAVVVSVTLPLTWTPTRNGSIVAMRDRDWVAAVDTDGDRLIVFASDGAVPLAAHATCDGPRTVSVWTRTASAGAPALDALVVACPDDDAIVIFQDGGLADPIRIDLPRGSRPFASAGRGNSLWVTLAGTGQVARVDDPDGLPPPLIVGFWRALPDVRGIAVWPDGRLIVSRWRSPDHSAELALIDPGSPPDAPPAINRLAVDPQAGSDTEIGGVPTYLDQILVSPTGREAAVPSLQANTLEGTFRSARPLTFETTVRAVVSWLFIDDGGVVSGEDFVRRKQFDDRGRAAGGVFTTHGDYLFVAMPGNRTVERLDVLGGDGQAGTLLDVGLAVDGVALLSDDRTLAALAPLSREIVLYDVSSFDQLPQPLARVRFPGDDPLPPQLRRGKQLFHDAADERLSKDGYIACAHCHLDGLSDNRTWDFTDRGEGLRNTHALGGHAQQGLLHWSANFDEVQDFEHDLRGPFRGRGLMTDDVFHTGTRDTTLGDAKAGLSGELDALAAYVASLREIRSPFRNPDGSLPAAAVRGQALFATLGCAGCHSGAQFTDSGLVSPGEPRLHDVGTLGPGSGQRLGAPLTGLDTPTLHGLWHAAPYLHDGSAATLDDVLSRHAPPLTTAERADLIAFLLTLEGA